MSKSATEHMQRAIAIAGSQQELARRMGIRQGHLWTAINRNRRISAEMAVAVEKATGGEVKREELRPDLFVRAALGQKKARPEPAERAATQPTE